MVKRIPTLQLEAKLQWLLGLSVGLVVLVAAVRWLYLPAVAHLREQRAVLNDLRVKIADARVLAEQLSQQQAALTAAREDYQALRGRVGDRQSVARVLEALGQQAGRHHLELATVQPPRADGEEPLLVTIGSELTLRAVPLRVQLKGRYQEIGEFLGEFPGAPFLATVNSLSITKPHADALQLEAELTLGVYLMEREPSS